MKKQRRQDVTTEIVVGAFMFMVLLVMAFFTIVVSQNKIFKKTYEMQVLFADVGGLKEGENVFLRGMKVGNVKTLEIMDENQGVLVTASLEREVKLWEDYTFEIHSASMLGGMRVVIEEGDSGKARIEDLNSLLGEPPVDLLNEATEAIRFIRNALENGGIVDDLQTAMSEFKQISTKLNNGTGTVARLINEDGIYTQIEDLTTNLQRVSEDIKVVSANLADGKGTLGKLLSDDESLYEEIQEIASSAKSMVANLEEVSDRIVQGKGTVGRLLSEDEELYNNLLTVTEDLKSFASNMNSGEGTIGKLMTDDELYHEVRALVGEARATIDDLRETSPITTFSSVFFGAF